MKGSPRDVRKREAYEKGGGVREVSEAKGGDWEAKGGDGR